MLEAGTSQSTGAGVGTVPPATNFNSAQPNQRSSDTKSTDAAGKEKYWGGINKTGIIVIIVLVIIAIVAGASVVLSRESGSDDSTTTGTTNSPSPTTAPSIESGTTTPTATFFPTTAPTTQPPVSSTLAECTIMVGDMRSVSHPLSFISQDKADSGILLTAVFERSHFVSASSPTSTLLLDFKAHNGEDPYNIGPVTGSTSVNENMEVTISATINNPNFYIRRMGGLHAEQTLVVNNIDPLGDDNSVAFQASVGTTPRSATAKSPFRTVVFDEDGDGVFCNNRATPSAACAGPWFSYTYVEVCPNNRFETKAPVTPPTPLVTPPPSTAPPLIELFFTNPSTPSDIREAFENARDFWNAAITNTHEPIDIPADKSDAGELGCVAEESVFPSGITQITGLTIFATVKEIDGTENELNILGQAGPCAFSYSGFTSTKFGNIMPRIGLMSFDVQDLQALVDNNSLERVVMHEMAHVLGMGTLWDRFREGSAGDSDNDPRYIGVNGIEGYKEIGGVSSNPPVANTGAAGTADSHWREETFEDELMTGLATGGLPVSIMTLKALQDLGYVVDESKAETYTVPLIRSNDIKAKAPVALMVNDILNFNKPRNFPLKDPK